MDIKCLTGHCIGATFFFQENLSILVSEFHLICRKMCGRRLGEYTRFQTVIKEHVVHAKAGDCLVINNHKDPIKPALKIINTQWKLSEYKYTNRRNKSTCTHINLNEQLPPTACGDEGLTCSNLMVKHIIKIDTIYNQQRTNSEVPPWNVVRYCIMVKAGSAVVRNVQLVVWSE